LGLVNRDDLNNDLPSAAADGGEGPPRGRVLGQPREADVVADLATKTYASIPCVIEGNTARPLLTQTATLRTDPLPLLDGTLVGGLAVARDAGFKADKKCDAVDGFTNCRKLISRALGIGNRWTEDGRWRW
jgi:hypothetical protein